MTTPRKIGVQQNFSQVPVLGLVVESSATAPANPVNGQVYYDQTTNRLNVRENGAWATYAALDGTGKVALANLPVATSGTSSATQIVRADDSRLSNARTPSGAAGGSLTGTYPNPTIANLAITDAMVAAANKDGAVATPSMRTIGTGATQAMAGNTRLDQIASPTAAVGMNSQKITGLADPTAATDAATKNYVDAARAGLRLKDAVRAISTANITLSGTQTIDGVAVVAGDRVLVAGQTSAATNGIYTVAAGAWTRATDADTAVEVNDGATTFVQQGTLWANSTWAQINTITTLGTDAQSWVQQGAATSYIDGNGLTLTGTTFDVNVDGSSIEINADVLRVKALGITNAMLAGGIDLTTKVTGTLPVANGGTGATTAAGARTSLGAVGKAAVDVPALTAGTEVTITHSLNTLDVQTQFRNNSSGYEEVVAWRVIDANTIGVTADIPYAAAALRVVVIG